MAKYFMVLYKEKSTQKGGKYIEFTATNHANTMKRVIKEMNAAKCKTAEVYLMEYDRDYRSWTQEDYGIMRLQAGRSGPSYVWDNSHTNFDRYIQSGTMDPKTGRPLKPKKGYAFAVVSGDRLRMV